MPPVLYQCKFSQQENKSFVCALSQAACMSEFFILISFHLRKLQIPYIELWIFMITFKKIWKIYCIVYYLWEPLEYLCVYISLYWISLWCMLWVHYQEIKWVSPNASKNYLPKMMKRIVAAHFAKLFQTFQIYQESWVGHDCKCFFLSQYHGMLVSSFNIRHGMVNRLSLLNTNDSIP